jgi:hypothetical protein
MGYFNTGNDFIERLVYDLRYEYTGYINIPNLVDFTNDILLEWFSGIVNNYSEANLSLAFPKLRVVTDNIATYNGAKYRPIISQNKYGDQTGNDYSRLFVIPKLVYSSNAETYIPTTINGVDYPNIARIGNIYVIDDDLYPQDQAVTDITEPVVDLDFVRTSVKLVSSNALKNARKNYYRKPNSNRVYGVLHHGQSGYSVIEVTGNSNYLMLEYYTFPSPIQYGTTSVVSELGESQLLTLKNIVKIKFLERINDPKFKNYIERK